MAEADVKAIARPQKQRGVAAIGFASEDDRGSGIVDNQAPLSVTGYTNRSKEQGNIRQHATPLPELIAKHILQPVAATSINRSGEGGRRFDKNVNCYISKLHTPTFYNYMLNSHAEFLVFLLEYIRNHFLVSAVSARQTLLRYGVYESVLHRSD